MDRFHLMSVFIAVAEEQGFASAARRMNMSAPAVTRAVATLEEKLGVKLLNRTTRHVRTTEAGMQYLENARRIIADVDAADEQVAGINATPRGQLSVTAPALCGHKFVTPIIVNYLEKYPETQIGAYFLDRVVNLIEEGMDVAVRIGELPDSSMRAIKVGCVRMVTCASPEYLEKHGEPQTPEELKNHNIIFPRVGAFTQDWRFEHNGNAQTIRMKPRLTISTNEAVITAAKQHFGITRLLSYQVADAVAAGDLKCILEEYEPTGLPVHVVHREGRMASVKVRAFIDMLVEQLRANPGLNWQETLPGAVSR